MKKNYLQPATVHGFCLTLMGVCSGTTIDGEKGIEEPGGGGGGGVEPL